MLTCACPDCFEFIYLFILIVLLSFDFSFYITKSYCTDVHTTFWSQCLSIVSIFHTLWKQSLLYQFKHLFHIFTKIKSWSSVKMTFFLCKDKKPFNRDIRSGLYISPNVKIKATRQTNCDMLAGVFQLYRSQGHAKPKKAFGSYEH